MSYCLQRSVISLLFAVVTLTPASSRSEVPVHLLNAAASADSNLHTPSAHDEGADDPAVHGEDHHGAHNNHAGLFLGGSTHLKEDDTAFTVGGHYGRRLSPRWTLGAVAEFLSSSLERDVIVLGTATYSFTQPLGFTAGAGVEFATRDVVHHGHAEQEKETELLLRLGLGYAIPIAGAWSLSPQFLADWTQHTWTLVYGVSLGYGF